MCLAIPGEITNITEGDSLLRMGEVSFGGVIKKVSLAYVPEAEVGDYVIVHSGFALSILDPEGAQETWTYLEQIRGQK